MMSVSSARRVFPGVFPGGLALLALLAGLAAAECAAARPFAADPPQNPIEAPVAPALAADQAPAPLETGLPLLRSFSPKEYGADTQNWAIVQDPRGVIYVGNAAGVLEFDGSRWRLIRVANQTVVRSLAVDAQGRVYVGALGEVGYLEADASGQTRYVSLFDQVPAEARDFADVWQTFVTPHGIVFSSFQRLFRLHGDRFESWTPTTSFHPSFRVGERLFIPELGRGLLELIEGELRLVPGGERFAEEKIRGMFALAEPGNNLDATASILLATQTQGFFLMYPDGFTPWPTAIDAELKRDLLYTGARLPDGRLALGTLQGGLYLLDVQGRLLGHFGKANGLPEQTVYAAFVDRERSLWLGTQNGVARVEVGGPLSRFDERMGLAGAVYAVHRHQGELYAGTTQGLYRLRPGPAARFERIVGIDSQTWALRSVGAALWVANYQGLYQVSGERAQLLRKSDTTTFALLASTSQPGRIYVGLKDGLALLRRVDERWLDAGRVAGISDEIRTLVEDRECRLWLSTRATGVLRLRFADAGADGSLPPPQIERYGVAEGLPSSINNWVYSVGGETLFATQSGIYRFVEDRRRFEPDPRFADLFPQPRAVFDLLEAPEQGVWLFASEQDSDWKQTGLASRQPDGSYRWESRALSALAGSAPEHRDPDGVLWFGSAEGLVRYDPRIDKNYDQPYPALLRRVSTREDRLIYGGNGEIAPPRLEYADNALRFEFAAPSFDAADAGAAADTNRFQLLLEGNDSDWSAWSTETYKDYSNLWEGRYRLRVLAQNLYGTLSDETVFAFTVLPPWYRTVWAYLGYLLAVGGSGWGALRWRLRRLQRQKAALEATVAERTADIRKLGEIGKELTATLDLEQAFERVYRQVEARLDAFTFWLGIHDPERGLIRMQYLVEGGARLPPFDVPLTETNRPAVWCVRERRELITHSQADLLNYVQDNLPPKVGGESESIVYEPLIAEDRVIGCLSVQSPRPNAYSPAQLEFLRVLAGYTAIALDKAQAYQQLGESHNELARSHQELGATHQRLVDTQQQLVLSEKMAALGTLTAGVAHEINNPLNFADVSAQNLRAALEDLHRFLIELAGGEEAPAEVLATFEQRFAALAEMNTINREGLKRIKAIVQDLRQFTRLDEAERKRVPIAEPIQSTVNLIRTKFDRTRFELNLEFNPQIDCQPAKLGQVFMSLIVNACEAIERAAQQRSEDVAAKRPNERCQGSREGLVCVLTRSIANDQIEIAVEDNGCGMDTATQAKVFEPFFTTKPVGAGTGLGLATAFGIVKEHGGTIEVESTADQGACFRVRLPLGAL